MTQEEWRLLIERTNAGLTLSRCMGTKSGKPIGRSPTDLPKLGIGERAVMEGKSIRAAAREVGIAEFVLRRRLLGRAHRMWDGDLPSQPPPPRHGWEKRHYSAMWQRSLPLRASKGAGRTSWPPPPPDCTKTPPSSL